MGHNVHVHGFPKCIDDNFISHVHVVNVHVFDKEVNALNKVQRHSWNSFIANNIPVQQIHSAFEHEHLEDDIHNQMRFDEIEPFLSQIDLSASIVKIDICIIIYIYIHVHVYTVYYDTYMYM